MKHIRTGKNKRGIKRFKVQKLGEINTSEVDKQVFDTVLTTLYNNADKDVLHLEKEIYQPNGIMLTLKHSERLWEVMLSSGWVSPVIGFGNSGKVALTQSGYQLMAQYGGYSKFLEAQQIAQQQQPQTIILPLQVQGEEQPQPQSEQKPEAPSKAAEETNTTQTKK
ncbi:MAG: hypothetical protein EOP51_03595 [Sphingobacteriales bacterium]|nr:MAG: hypothetical protein EOP51_03595 [Sphingobacteriales bacterium]